MPGGKIQPRKLGLLPGCDGIPGTRHRKAGGGRNREGRHPKNQPQTPWDRSCRHPGSSHVLQPWEAPAPQTWLWQGGLQAQALHLSQDEDAPHQAEAAALKSRLSSAAAGLRAVLTRNHSTQDGRMQSHRAPGSLPSLAPPQGQTRDQCSATYPAQGVLGLRDHEHRLPTASHALCWASHPCPWSDGALTQGGR